MACCKNTTLLQYGYWVGNRIPYSGCKVQGCNLQEIAMRKQHRVIVRLYMCVAFQTGHGTYREVRKCMETREDMIPSEDIPHLIAWAEQRCEEMVLLNQSMAFCFELKVRG